MTSDPVERYLVRASRVGRRSRLRPLKESEVLDLAGSVYQTLGWTIIRASAIPALLSLGGFAFLLYYVMPGFFWTDKATRGSDQVKEAALNFLLGIVVAGPLILIGMSLVCALVAPLVSDFMLGNVPNIASAEEAQKKSAARLAIVSLWESLLSTSGALIGGMLLMLSWYLSATVGPSLPAAGLVLIIGCIALAVGSLVPLYIASVHALVGPIVVLENVGAVQAARRSKQLMRASRYHSNGYGSIWLQYLLLGFIALILILGSYTAVAIIGVSDWMKSLGPGPLRPILETALELAPVFVTLWIVIPVWAVNSTIVYLERRVRLEGYDIEALASDVWRSDRQTRFQL